MHNLMFLKDTLEMLLKKVAGHLNFDAFKSDTVISNRDMAH